MIHATSLPGYRDAKDFDKPEGIESTIIDSDTLQVATPNCPATREEVYVNGSGPTQMCELHGGGHNPVSAAGSFLSHIFGGGNSGPPPPSNGSTLPGPGGQPVVQSGQPNGDQPTVDPAKAPEKKKGPLQKFFGIFGDKKKKDPAKPKPDKGDSP
jgi:hypothetical protein